MTEKICNNCGRKYKGEKDYLNGTSRWRVCESKNLWFNCECKSTLMIPAGKYPWFDPQNFMSPEAGSVFNRLGGMKDLPHIPSAIMRIQQMCSEESPDVGAITESVKKDPFLADEILQTAHTLKLSRGEDEKPIESIKQAVMYIGISTLEWLILNIAIKKFKLKTNAYNTHHFWREAYMTGLVSEHIARTYFPKLSPDESYISGCLLNLGKLVGGICLPEETDNIFNYIKNPKTVTSWYQAENRIMAISHVRLGEIGAVMWGLSTKTADAINNHHRNPHTEYNQFNLVLSLASQLAHHTLWQYKQSDKKTIEYLTNRLKLQQTDIEKIVSMTMPLATAIAPPGITG